MEVRCPRCSRTAKGWIIKRADVCSPKHWKNCIREPEAILAKRGISVMDTEKAWRWLLRDPNGAWTRYPTEQAALDASDKGHKLYFEDNDGDPQPRRRGVKSNATQLR